LPSPVRVAGCDSLLLTTTLTRTPSSPLAASGAQPQSVFYLYLHLQLPLQRSAARRTFWPRFVTLRSTVGLLTTGQK
jgi:hypothetical protein